MDGWMGYGIDGVGGVYRWVKVKMDGWMVSWVKGYR